MYSHNRDGPPPITTLPSKQSFTLPCLHTRASVNLLTNHRADPGRLRLRNTSTRGAHFWKPATHDILMRLLITSLSLNFSSWDWVFFSATPSIPTLVKFCKYKPFSFKNTFSLRRVSDTYLPTCGSSQLLCCFLYSVSIFANYHMDWCNHLCIQQVSVKDRVCRSASKRWSFFLLASLPWLTLCRWAAPFLSWKANYKTRLDTCTDCWVWFKLFVLTKLFNLF